MPVRTLCCAAAVTFLGTASAAAGPHTASRAPRCTSAALVVWLDTRGNGALGSAYYRLNFTNLSGRTCALFGYPGVSGVSLAGRRLGDAAGRDPAVPRRLVRLPPGRTAAAVLRVVDVENYPRARCRPVLAAGLRVYPPDETQAKLVPFPFRACSRGGVSYLAVRAVR